MITSDHLRSTIARRMETETDPLAIALGVIEDMGNNITHLRSALRFTLPEYVRSMQREERNRQPAPLPPVLSRQPSATVIPGKFHSPKITSMQNFDLAAWRQEMMHRTLVTARGSQRFAVCTAIDFEYAADENRRQIAGNEVSLTRNLALAKAIRRHKVETLAGVPDHAIKAAWDEAA